MRTCFFIATKQGTAGAILHSAPNLTKFQQADDQGNPIGKPSLLYNPQGTLDKDQMIELRVHRCNPVDDQGNSIPINIAGSLWTVWLLIPTSEDWRKGPRALRKMIRARLGTEVLGPYAKPALKRARPALHDILCPDDRLPHVIMGDDKHLLGKIDYEPTQQEADDDTEPSIEILDTA